ncbi:hypothetical protein GAH_01620 [Geoglobus ahangari]|uniref:XACb0070 ribbon-helix-helix domain-containing protein n=1 Tax=Geoglobus ahangari TaxID=113653 RepID=A0A0F7IF80_9EURY|nr:ribbon-helix-helix protein, CopG family [Geoglobus ahangari]AKG91093.1 hypothetical protein GAH_01620 [Geoglobus ahangari]
MGTITISLNDEIERKLREHARNGGKGALSKVIEQALRLYFSKIEERKTVFRAFKGDEQVAEAENLEELAEILKAKKIDPREVTILSSKPVKPVVRRGWR